MHPKARTTAGCCWYTHDHTQAGGVHGSDSMQQSGSQVVSTALWRQTGSVCSWPLLGVKYWLDTSSPGMGAQPA